MFTALNLLSASQIGTDTHVITCTSMCSTCVMDNNIESFTVLKKEQLNTFT